MIAAADKSFSIPSWAWRLLVFAAAWTVLLSTVAGIVAPGFAAGLPNHTHETLNGVVPPHTHMFDAGTGRVTCSTDTVATPDVQARSEQIACGASSDATSASGSLLMAGEPVGNVRDMTFDLISAVTATARYLAPAVYIATPPPAWLTPRFPATTAREASATSRYA